MQNAGCRQCSKSSSAFVRRNVIGPGASLLCKLGKRNESDSTNKNKTTIHIGCPLKNKHHVPCSRARFFNGNIQLHAVYLAFHFFIPGARFTCEQNDSRNVLIPILCERLNGVVFLFSTLSIFVCNVFPTLLQHRTCFVVDFVCAYKSDH